MNTHHTPDGDQSVVPSTTNILAEPIAERGLRSRYQILGDGPWNDTGILTVEVLLKPSKALRCASLAAETGLRVEIVHDVNGKNWHILEAQGCREAVEVFASKLEAGGIHQAD